MNHLDSRDVWAMLDGIEMAGDRRHEMQEHLSACPQCQRLWESVDSLHRGISSVLEPPAGNVDLVLARVRDEWERKGGWGDAASEVAGASSHLTAGGRKSHAWTRTRGRLVVLSSLGLGVAAIGVIAAVHQAGLAGSMSRTTDSTAMSAQSPSSAMMKSAATTDSSAETQSSNVKAIHQAVVSWTITVRGGSLYSSNSSGGERGADAPLIGAHVIALQDGRIVAHAVTLSDGSCLIQPSNSTPENLSAFAIPGSDGVLQGIDFVVWQTGFQPVVVMMPPDSSGSQPAVTLTLSSESSGLPPVQIIDRRNVPHAATTLTNTATAAQLSVSQAEALVNWVKEQR